MLRVCTSTEGSVMLRDHRLKRPDEIKPQEIWFFFFFFVQFLKRGPHCSSPTISWHIESSGFNSLRLGRYQSNHCTDPQSESLIKGHTKINF